MERKIYLLDATVRDGGFVNSFAFDDDFVHGIYKANAATNIDCMEFGYRGDRRLYNSERYGRWKFSSDEDIRRIIRDDTPQMAIAVMCDVGRTDYLNDIHSKNESPVDIIRVATYIDTIPEAIRMIEHASKLGYKTSCNIMAISTCNSDKIQYALSELAQTPVDYVYAVDSFGAMYPKQVRELVSLFCEHMEPNHKLVGFHAHNNQQCAFANTIEASDAGATMLDATAYGIGRGAGNCNMEALVGYIGGKYKLHPMLDLIEHTMLPQKEQGAVWGYNTSYLLTGLTNTHPRTAINATKNNDVNFIEQYDLLADE